MMKGILQCFLPDNFKMNDEVASNEEKKHKFKKVLARMKLVMKNLHWLGNEARNFVN